ncbi:DUF4373 domain-containing protein [Empedobacter sp. UBA6305]|uniref:DUF4373 domain-containing protein n=1 Tax=Empedobacter sp. UBA6305 TaxID=1946445 RepID=UPI0025C1C5BF|nr:DUF4373 domain-containing protein [Empedobacter sp. UBA6305]
MARPKKVGLDYFPLDIDFFEDIKIRKLIKYLGSKSISIYTYMLCKIYKEGYFIKWDSELPFIVSEATGSKEEYVNEVLKFCLKNHLFSEELYNKHNILSSKGIQERYKLICLTAKRKFNISKYNLVNSEFSTQSKVNKSKVITSSNEEVKKNTQKKDLGCVSENLNEEENSNSKTSKNLEEEKEKNCEKKEKELPKGFTTELRDSQFFKNVCEFFSQKSELLQMKVIGRMISIAREKDFEEFRKQTKAYMDYKNQTGEKVHRFQNFSFEWDQDDWIDKLKKINQTKTQNGNAKSESDDIIVGRVNVTKTESYLESRRRQREMESARTFETDI